MKKYFETAEEHPRDVALDSFRQTLIAVGKTTVVAMPVLGVELDRNLTALSNQLAKQYSPTEIADSQGKVEAELQQWGVNARSYLQRKTDELREIMMSVSRMGDAIGERDHRYVSHFQSLSAGLQASASLEDLAALRKSVVKSAADITECVAQMKAEGERGISELRKEVENYRDRLEDAERRATQDFLTGLFNRAAIEREMEARVEHGQRFSVILLDLNGFKLVNDQYGHSAGDELLKTFAGEMKSHFGPLDMVGRWGGDEFVGLVDFDRAGAEDFCDRLAHWVLGSYKIKAGDQTVKVQVSAAIGVATWDRKESAAQLLARADSAMYREKSGVKS